MANNLSVWLATLLVIIALLLGGIVAYAMTPTAKDTITLVDKPVLVETPYNDTALVASVNAIAAKQSEDDTWDAAAEKLATAEWQDKSNKDLFNAMQDLGLNIVDKEDITSVKIDDSDVSNQDIDDQDADVTQDLIVRYEDADGNHAKAYITVDTEIVENDVDNQEFSLS